MKIKHFQGFFGIWPPRKFEPYLGADFGSTAAIEEFLAQELKNQRELGLPAYKIEWPFETSLKESKVTLDFECLIKGYEGRLYLIDLLHLTNFYLFFSNYRIEKLPSWLTS